MFNRGRIGILVAAVGLVLAIAPGVAAQKIVQEPIRPVDGVSGPETFKAYCSQCHGVDGKGGGPAARALKVPPADLTQIAKRNGGKFDPGKVRNSITGENELPAHGSREMPMWGPVLRSVDSATVTDLRVRNLVVYLESLQVK
jgi:mono/diheme cytochrome c family protein